MARRNALIGISAGVLVVSLFVVAVRSGGGDSPFVDRAAELTAGQEDEEHSFDSIAALVGSWGCLLAEGVELVADPDTVPDGAGAWSQRATLCGNVAELGRRNDEDAGEQAPDPWLFLRTGDDPPVEGWLDVERLCGIWPAGSPPVEHPFCRFFLGDLEDEALSDDFASLPMMNPRMSAEEQVAEAMCRGVGFLIARSPALSTGSRPGPGLAASAPGWPGIEPAPVSPGFCGEVEVLGRLEEVPTARQDQAFGPTVVLPWLYVRLGAPVEREGWVHVEFVCNDGTSGADMGEVLPVCDLEAYSDPAPPPAAALRTMDELRQVPVVAPAPLQTDGSPDLVITFDPPEEGEPCAFSVAVTVENVGTAATPAILEVTVGATTHELRLFRGVEPGEGFGLPNVDYETGVVVDPADRIPELDESNNGGSAPPNPDLDCVFVPGTTTPGLPILPR